MTTNQVACAPSQDTAPGLASQDSWEGPQVRQAPEGDADHQLFQARTLVKAWLTRFVQTSLQGST